MTKKSSGNGVWGVLERMRPNPIFKLLEKLDM